MAKIRKLYDDTVKPDGNRQSIYPITSTRAVYNTANITIEALLNEGYRCGGVVTPSDTPPFIDQRVFYGAGIEGLYQNFGGFTVGPNELVLLLWDGTVWTKQVLLQVDSYTTEQVQELLTPLISDVTTLKERVILISEEDYKELVDEHRVDLTKIYLVYEEEE